MLSQVVRGIIILGWVILPSLGNVTQPDVDVNAVYTVMALKLRCFVAIMKLA